MKLKQSTASKNSWKVWFNLHIHNRFYEIITASSVCILYAHGFAVFVYIPCELPVMKI